MSLTHIQDNININIFLLLLGMAFALLTSVAPVYGLYTSFFPVVLYMLFGTGHHVSTGKRPSFTRVWLCEKTI